MLAATLGRPSGIVGLVSLKSNGLKREEKTLTLALDGVAAESLLGANSNNGAFNFKWKTKFSVNLPCLRAGSSAVHPHGEIWVQVGVEGLERGLESRR